MRWLIVCGIVLGCSPAPMAGEPHYAAPYAPPMQFAAASYDPTRAGTVVARQTDFVFEGGRVEIELRRDGNTVTEVARNFYAVPLVLAWSVTDSQNLAPLTAPAGVVTLPAGPAPDQAGAPVVLMTHRLIDSRAGFTRNIAIHARWGDPRARPTAYAYRLPYKAGQTYSVLQGFHGTFSHHGSNEFAVDFDCPVATSVLAARDGLVVAANTSAQGSGTTPEYLDYRRVNFVLVLHDDGTLGEYMHLAPAGLRVTVGQRVARGDELALSGNTGFSSTPHLHFGVMTAAQDGMSALSFPFQFLIQAKIAEAPVQGRSYAAFE